LHELRYGELAHFKLIPHTPYYGTADATPLYLIALHAAWKATGDRTLIERHLSNAEACLTWIDKYGKQRHQLTAKHSVNSGISGILPRHVIAPSISAAATRPTEIKSSQPSQ
jgi:glycogen debranching enzyme